MQNDEGALYDDLFVCQPNESRIDTGNFVELLCGHKIKFFKKGRYSCVYKNQHSGTILKVGDANNNAGYLAFLALARIHQDNPFFPRIYYSALFKDEDGQSFFLVHMERLLEGKAYLNTRLYMPSWWRVSRFIRDCVDKEGYLLDNFMGHQTPVSLMNCIFYLKNAFQYNEFDWDLHEGNMMMRDDGNLVITDPWA